MELVMCLLDGFIGLTTHCTVEPPCRYCWNSSTINISGFGPETDYRLRCERTRYIRIPSGTVSGWEVRT